ncbi:MAG: tRNA (Guanine37-N1) -methyltransferase [Myxococcaceae bacterium]|nr:tRNA (Guanine37-N1) -methyltransferase [Myxococcaceae bacterium]
MTGPIYLALVHHPVRGRGGDEITTSVTNLDVHDIARTARTYGIVRYYVVTPITAQRDLVNHILGYWRVGKGGERVPERTEALSIVEDVDSIEAAIAAITAREGRAPRVVTTAAKERAAATSFDALRAELAASDGPWLLMFGTGYGLADRVLDRADVHLAPVRPGGYNHLAVRSAVAIIIDRLLGDG